jgi:hypothetical protein
MGQYTITLTPEEEKALLTDMISIQDWVDNAIHNKARQCIDSIIEQVSDKQPKKISADERAAIVRTAQVESAADRQARIEAELLRAKK